MTLRTRQADPVRCNPGPVRPHESTPCALGSGSYADCQRTSDTWCLNKQTTANAWINIIAERSQLARLESLNFLLGRKLVQWSGRVSLTQSVWKIASASQRSITEAVNKSRTNVKKSHTQTKTNIDYRTR